ncbi:MAG: hypothetical protein O3C32_09485, partial [Bacteroidetes bacterium]|nr:hypothetical protein [Bacteroidota bacterium]
QDQRFLKFFSKIKDDMPKPPEKIIKEYPARGPLTQFRFEKLIHFTCSRCNQAKTSKMLAISDQNWDNILCNGCYGLMLSK